ncbi:magnesium-dependent phosphatase-1 [Shewanella sp.]|uniref:magnesium-dependent phosphatase-1 n=1 Tax=Shewanella sp. TaxID=50422 RepID=UPI003A987400
MTDIQLVVFDLDFTLWDCGGTWCDHTVPPYQRHGDHICDAEGNKISLYADVANILHYAQQQQLPLALASRTYQPTWAKKLLQLFEIDEYFDIQQIFPDSKRTHFANIHQHTGVAYHNMLFFDDEVRNIQDVSSLGVKAVYVENGINWPLFQQQLAAA